jgi:hypothetical protein
VPLFSPDPLFRSAIAFVMLLNVLVLTITTVAVPTTPSI